MKDITHIFIDVDGTIVKHDQSIHPKTKDAIALAKEAGINIWLATGRPVHELDPLLQTLNIDHVIGYNGAYARKNQTVIYEKHMDETLVDYFIDTVEKSEQELVLYSDTHNLFSSFKPSFVQRFIDHFGITLNKRYTPEARAHIYGMTLLNCQDTDLSRYQKEANLFFSQVNVTGMTDHYDVIQQDVNKGKAIEAVLKAENTPHSKAVAIGDGMNDKDMLKTAGIGIAMGNAHPDLLTYADYTTKTVDEGGLYDAFIYLGIIPNKELNTSK